MQMLENKVGLVTGGGVGIGRAICEAFAREGAKVIVADFNTETGQETVAAIQAAGGDAHFVAADVSDEDQVKAMIEAAVSVYGGIDIACNSAAVSRGSGPIHEFERSVFDDTLEMCLTNTWLCLKHEVTAMLASGKGGSIVNISSNSSLRGQPYNTAYAAAKSGVNILTKSAAVEYGKKGIRINAVSPGVIRTPGIEKYFKEQPKIAEALERSAAMNRIGEPSEVAGQLISVDGGSAVK